MKNVAEVNPGNEKQLERHPEPQVGEAGTFMRCFLVIHIFPGGINIHRKDEDEEQDQQIGREHLQRWNQQSCRGHYFDDTRQVYHRSFKGNERRHHHLHALHKGEVPDGGEDEHDAHADVAGQERIVGSRDEPDDRKSDEKADDQDEKRFHINVLMAQRYKLWCQHSNRISTEVICCLIRFRHLRRGCPCDAGSIL